MDKEDIMMTAMEERLSGDEQGAYRDEVLGLLGQEAQSIKAKMDAGLSPDEFKSASMMYEALIAAQKVVEAYWQGSRQVSQG